MTLASTTTAVRAQPEELGSLNEQLLQDPRNVELNLHYAHVAEEQGKLRLALAAYERVLINDPDNVQAQQGYERIRRVIEPAYSAWRVEVGEQWDSNPLNLSEAEESGATTYANVSWVDERRLGSRRWRTFASFRAEVTPEIDELNYGYASIQMGPFFDVTPTCAAIPAVGLAVSSLANEFYYAEINGSLTLEGHSGSATYWARGRVGWRSYGEDSLASQGAYAELMGGVSLPHIFSANDWITVVPWLRWSGIEGSTLNFQNDQIAPGQYWEFGLEAAYNYRISDHLSVAVGATGRDRFYSETEVAGENRRDAYIAPKASLTVWNALSCQCGLQFSYQYRDNRSNDPLSEYTGSQASVSLFRQF
jgi:hypothetical protein